MRHTAQFKLRILPASVIASLLFATSAHAQDAKPAEKSEVGKLDAITVTAERRSENIKDVPNSVSAVRGEALDVINSGGQDIRMLAGRVPSLNIESSFGRAFPRFYIRGLGNGDFDLNASQPVSLVFDDVVQENPILKGFPLFDIEQVEVLRGPQGTLFGRNSPAGVIKFETVKPGRTQEGYMNLSTGLFNTSSVEGAYNAPLSATSAIRFSIQNQKRDNWVDNLATGPTKKLEGYSDFAGRVQYLLEPSKAFSALFNLHHRDLEGSARVFRANIIQRGTNNTVAGFDPALVTIDGKNQQNARNTGGSLRLKWDLGKTTLRSITGYESVRSLSRGDIDGGFGAAFLPSGSRPGVIPFDAESADGLPFHKQVTQEFRLESNGGGAHKWLVGAYMFNEDIKIDSINFSSLAPGNPRNGFAQQTQNNKATALFASVTQDLSAQFSMRGGLRVTRDKKDFTAERTLSPISFLGAADRTGVLKANPSASDLSWDVSGTYKLDKDTNLYARAARGFRAPSIQGRLLFGDTLSVANSEKVISVEAGIKADLMNRRARVAANVFSYSVKDQQLTAVGGQANFNRLINAAKTEGRGAELDFQAFVTDNLRLSVSGSINDTKIRDKNLAVAACGAPCTVLDPAGRLSGTFSIDGNPLPQAPKYVSNLTLRYGVPMASGEFYVYSDVSFRSKINFFLYESREYTGKPLTETGLRVGYKFGQDKYEIAAYGRNIANQIRVVGGIDFNNLTGFINEPRLLGVQFKAQF